MKLCVIGNSHVGVLRASEDVAHKLGFQVQYYAVPGDGPWPSVIDTEGVISATSPEIIELLERYKLPTALSLAETDVIIIVGTTATVFHSAELLKNHVFHTQPRIKRNIYRKLRERISKPAGRNKILTTKNAISESLESIIIHGTTYKFVELIRENFDTPIILVCQPAPHVSITERGKFRLISDRNEGPLHRELIESAHLSVFSSFSDVHVVSQHEKTLERGFLTSTQYTKSSVRLDTGRHKSKTDILHANREYGVVVWHQIDNIVDSLS